MSLLSRLANWAAAITLPMLTAVSAAEANAPIVMACNTQNFAPLCDGAREALKHRFSPHPVVWGMPDDQAEGPVPLLNLNLNIDQRSEHSLAASIVWRTSSGASGEGPLVELSVMDARINDSLLRTFGGHLVQATPIPL